MSVPAYKRKSTGLEALVDFSKIFEKICSKLLVNIVSEDKGKNEILYLLKKKIIEHSDTLLKYIILATSFPNHNKENEFEKIINYARKEQCILNIELKIFYNIEPDLCGREALNISTELSNLDKTLLKLLNK